MQAYVIPTDRPEADGTLRWDRTTVVVAELAAGGQKGIGLSYSSKASAQIIAENLRDPILGKDAWDIPARWLDMVRSVRNLGRPGAASEAISAVDLALWDLKAKLLGVPLVRLLGGAREDVKIYGSGGFTSYTEEELELQLAGWAQQGIRSMKIKVGSDPSKDPERVHVARQAIGSEAGLFVDANGAYDRKQALALAERFAVDGVSWFEEPVSSDDLEGLRLIRERAPAGMRIAAGEYGFDPWYFRRMLEARAVDVIQADLTRCLGGSGFLQAAALADAYFVPLSSHCAPSMHLHFACSAARFELLEYFHDHARIEAMLLDGSPKPVNGALRPDLSRPGMGIEIKRRDAEKFAA